MSLKYQEANDPIQMSEAHMQHHLKYIGRTGGFKNEDGTSSVPSPAEVVDLGWESRSYLEQFKPA